MDGLLHTLRTAYTAYCIIIRSLVPRSQRVCHLSIDHVVLITLHSHNYKSTDELSLSHHCEFLLIYCLLLNCLQLLLHSRLIMASKCIAILAPSQPLSLSPNSHDQGLHVHMINTGRCISKLPRSQLLSTSPNSLDYIFHVNLQSPLIMAFKWISKPARL